MCMIQRLTKYVETCMKSTEETREGIDKGTRKKTPIGTARRMANVIGKMNPNCL